MSNPVDVGQINAYAGDPLTLVFVFQDQDYTGKTFKSQLRGSAADSTEKTHFTVIASVSNGTTTVTCSLTGDSTFGQQDGQTRLLGPKAVFDLQRIDTATNVPEETMLKGTLLVDTDVTR